MEENQVPRKKCLFIPNKNKAWGRGRKMDFVIQITYAQNPALALLPKAEKALVGTFAGHP